MPGPDIQRWAGYLPPETTSFIGRVDELAEIIQLLADSQLVTLTGERGVGKTRLARRVAASLRGEFSHGAWFVDLSGLTDPDLLAMAVMRALRAQDQTARPAAEALAGYLAGKRLLLVLDSCQDLPEACAALVTPLLRAAPGLRVLATGSHPLGVRAERVHPVPPLSLPKPPGSPATDSEALDLLLDRARSVTRTPGTDVADTAPGDVDDLAELCRRLGGVPLGIELAAARLAHAPPSRLLAGLTECVARHADPPGEAGPAAMLRATLEWVHGLCGPEERRLWAELSVFAPGFDLQAVEYACRRGRLRSERIGPLLDRLARAALVIPQGDAEGVRYRVPGPVAEYGRERLRDLGDETTLLAAHRDFYLRGAREGEAAWSGGNQLAWHRRLGRDLPNIRAALAFCLRRPAEHEAGLLMASALWYLWLAAGLAREGRYFLERLLKVVNTPSATRTKALWVCGGVAAVQGDLAGAEGRAGACLTMAEREGDLTAVGYGVQVMGTIALLSGDAPVAIQRLGSALGRHRANGELMPGLLLGLPQLAAAHSLIGELEPARDLLAECIAKCDEAGELWARGIAVYVRGVVAHRAGELAAAWTHARDALRIKRLFEDVAGGALCLELLAWVSAGQGNAERAARLLGAAQENWSVFGLSHAGSPFDIPQHRECERLARDALGDPGYESVLEEGRRLDLTDAIAYALGEDLGPFPPPGAARTPPEPVIGSLTTDRACAAP